ncbi:MAG: nuclear transport factor 2 family protein [Pseudomonadota bacterium]
MTPTEFIERYEAALKTQDWAVVAPLISDAACVIFSNGTVHVGKAAIKAAYERNYATIKNEAYRVENVHWLLEAADSAAYMFDFHWTGVINGREAAGGGRGTAVLVREADGWVLMGEQLGPMPPG